MSPRPQGGWRAGAPVARRPGGGVGGREEGGPRRCSPPPCPGGVARSSRPCPPSSPAHPPWVHTFSRGCRAALGAGRGLVGRGRVSVAGGGGERPLCRGLLPRLPRAGTKAGLFVCAFLGAAVPLRPTAPAQAAEAQAPAAKRKSTGEEPAPKKKKTVSKPEAAKSGTGEHTDESDGDEEEECEEGEEGEPQVSQGKTAKKAAVRPGSEESRARPPFKQPARQSHPRDQPAKPPPKGKTSVAKSLGAKLQAAPKRK